MRPHKVNESATRWQFRPSAVLQTCFPFLGAILAPPVATNEVVDTLTLNQLMLIRRELQDKAGPNKVCQTPKRIPTAESLWGRAKERDSDTVCVHGRRPMYTFITEGVRNPPPSPLPPPRPQSKSGCLGSSGMFTGGAKAGEEVQHGRGEGCRTREQRGFLNRTRTHQRAKKTGKKERKKRKEKKPGSRKYKGGGG